MSAERCCISRDRVKKRPETDRFDTIGGLDLADTSADVIQLVANCCRAYLLQKPDPDLARKIAPDNSSEFLSVLSENRLWRAVELGMSHPESGSDLPFGKEFKAARGRAMLSNLKLLELANRAVPALKNEGIRSVVFKGPMHNRQLHGDPFFRRSNDLDLLISRSHFHDAIEVLSKEGFIVGAGRSSKWWTESLGEVHLVHRSGGVVDLHHRVQQPGCPLAKRSIDFVRAMPDLYAIGEVQIPTLRQPLALLISALNLVKEMMHRKPCAHYALDVAAGTMALRKSDLGQLGDFAHDQRLLQTLRLAIAIASRVFGSSLLCQPSFATLEQANPIGRSTK